MIQYLTNPFDRDMKTVFNITEDYAPGSLFKTRKFAGKLKQIVSLLIGIPVADLEKESVKASELPEEWDYIAKAIQLDDRKWVTIPGPVLPTMEDRAHKLTVRRLLQLMGTDACRNIIHENIWVNSLFADYTGTQQTKWHEVRIDKGWTPPFCINCKTLVEDIAQYVCDSCLEKDKVYPNWIISDTRFPNEAQAIKDRGGIVVRINRGKKYWEDPDWLAGKKQYTAPINLHPSETSLDSWEFDYTIDNSDTIEELLEQVRTMLLHFKIIT